jgi:hypothetical protein
MKWQIALIAMVVALFQFSGQAAEARCHHHHRWMMNNMAMNNGMGMNGMGMNGMGYGGYNGYNAYANPYAGFNRNMGGFNGMANSGVMGRLMRGF